MKSQAQIEVRDTIPKPRKAHGHLRTIERRKEVTGMESWNLVKTWPP